VILFLQCRTTGITPQEKASRFQPSGQSCFFSFTIAPREASFLEKHQNFTTAIKLE
jgi:hypothetical protein